MGSELPPAALPPHPTLSPYYDAPGQKRNFLKKIFDDTAGDYDRMERLASFGTGPWYRREALKRAGLSAGMRVLDVAVGTGLVAREEIAIVGSPSLVTGLDPSIGMMKLAVEQLGISAIRGVGESLPLADEQFDFLSMGYALRHLSDLRAAFAEFHRVLKPGGRVCILEITRPTNLVQRTFLRAYMKGVLPLLSRVTSGRSDTQKLWAYYWDTIDQCLPAQQVLDALTAAGFAGVKRYSEMGMFSEYTGSIREHSAQ